MTTVAQDVGGSLTATTITASTQFTGPGTGLTSIPGSQVGSIGGNNRAVITNGSGALTSEAQLAASRGGTALDTSSSTGIAHISAGTWSVSLISSADLAIGFSVTNAQTTATSANTPSAIVARDGSGNFSAGAITTTSLVQVPSLGRWTHVTASVQTTNNTPTNLTTISLSDASVTLLEVSIVLRSGDASNNAGVVSYKTRLVMAAGAQTNTGFTDLTTILDTNVATISYSIVNVSSGVVGISVTGIAAKTINWVGHVNITTLT